MGRNFPLFTPGLVILLVAGSCAQNTEPYHSTMEVSQPPPMIAIPPNQNFQLRISVYPAVAYVRGGGALFIFATVHFYTDKADLTVYPFADSAFHLFSPDLPLQFRDHLVSTMPEIDRLCDLPLQLPLEGNLQLNHFPPQRGAGLVYKGSLDVRLSRGVGSAYVVKDGARSDRNFVRFQIQYAYKGVVSEVETFSADTLDERKPQTTTAPSPPTH